MEQIGRYQIVRELGRGAMGVVFLATDPTIGRSVAIKTIRLGEVPNPEDRAKLRERLFREARSAGILSHPGIVTIYDMEEVGDLAYIAMEYVNGPTLDQMLAAGALPGDKVLNILRQTAAALDYAHQKGIIHRDIKPANIMMDQDGTIKITDFGIAKATTSEYLTLTHTIVGTPNYMSPEQVQGMANIDGRADQFSLAVIAYEMMTGERPFAGEHLTTVVYKIVAQEPIPPLRLNPTLGAQIDAVLRRGLAKKAAARYGCCSEFVDKLEEACAATKGWKNLPRGGSLDLPTLAAAPPRFPAPAKPKRLAETSEAREARRVGVLPVLLAILVAAGLIGLIAWQATPWLARTAKTETPAPPKPAPPPPPTQLAEQKPSPLGPPQSTEPVPENPKPRAETPDAAETEQPTEKPAVRPPAPAVLQPVWVATNPPGATAALDGRSDSECRTPCTLQAAPGRHRVAVTLAGHQTEVREITVGNGPQDLPLITLRSQGGTLMLVSSPPGASISVNGRQWPQSTPAQLNLAPGTYSITIEKDGVKKTERVEIRNGVISHLRIQFGQ